MPFRNLKTEAPYVDVQGVCEGCGIAVRPDEKYSYVQVTGWKQIGTARKLANEKATGRTRCASCGTLDEGEQGALFQ